MSENQPVYLTTREHRALRDLLTAQIAFEDGAPPEPTAEERDHEMHGVRHPIQDGDEVLYPIACRKNVMHRRHDEDLVACRWRADDKAIQGAVSCTLCGKCEGPGMVRHEKLRSMVDGTYLPSTAEGEPSIFDEAGAPERAVEITTIPKITISHGGGWDPRSDPRAHDPTLNECVGMVETLAEND